VLEDGRGPGDLQGRAQLADGRGLAVPEDEVLDGLEDLSLPEGQFPSQGFRKSPPGANTAGSMTYRSILGSIQAVRF
jgi:hypothetical protein